MRFGFQRQQTLLVTTELVIWRYANAFIFTNQSELDFGIAYHQYKGRYISHKISSNDLSVVVNELQVFQMAATLLLQISEINSNQLNLMGAYKHAELISHVILINKGLFFN
jgi:hypothetical protein